MLPTLASRDVPPDGARMKFKELDKPIEELSLTETNRHRAQAALLLSEPDADVTMLVEMLCILRDRARELSPQDFGLADA